MRSCVCRTSVKTSTMKENCLCFPFMKVNHSLNRFVYSLKIIFQLQFTKYKDNKMHPAATDTVSGSIGRHEEAYKKKFKSLRFALSKGLQRVVLFTEEQHIYKIICESEKVQLAEQEVILALQNVGVSLVNNSSSQEVSYIGITR